MFLVKDSGTTDIYTSLFVGSVMCVEETGFKNGKTIPQPNGFVNMIHQEDCIEIIHEIIDQNCWNTTFNACSNDHPTRKEFYTNARKSLNFDPPIFEENPQLRYKIISSKKLQAVLGYQFIHDYLIDS